MNNHEPPREWLDGVLREYFALEAQPSTAYLERCHSAAIGALDILKMQEHREALASEPGSLAEHIRSLAKLAGVKLQAVFQALGIKAESDCSAAAALGWAQLAQILGLARDEAVLRLRWGFACLAGVVRLEDWPDAEPVRARDEVAPGQKSRSLAETLKHAEASYAPQRRADLRAALNAVTKVYETPRA